MNNAGVDTLTGEARQWPFERKLHELLAVDVAATMLLSRDAGGRMHAAGNGVIINMGWDGADIGMAGDSGQLFAAAKGAVMAFSKSLALTLAPQVRVNCLAPGWIRTAWGQVAAGDLARTRAPGDAAGSMGYARRCGGDDSLAGFTCRGFHYRPDDPREWRHSSLRVCEKMGTGTGWQSVLSGFCVGRPEPVPIFSQALRVCEKMGTGTGWQSVLSGFCAGRPEPVPIFSQTLRSTWTGLHLVASMPTHVVLVKLVCQTPAIDVECFEDLYHRLNRYVPIMSPANNVKVFLTGLEAVEDAIEEGGFVVELTLQKTEVAPVQFHPELLSL